MAKHKREYDEEAVAEVNVIPLADVCLTLVIIIMVISPMILQSMIQVQASQAVAAPAQVRVNEKPIFIDITTKGYSVNNNPISSEYELYRTLQRNLSRMRDRTVLISSAADVQYQNVVRVLDLAKQSGARSLSLVPRKDAKAGKT
ncbi:MAG: biopolymer transporter ExbD [Elusimicrobia bacterium]|nr:biopolymer transporter ExbD [Candidatus Obscuribacterium magneticum]